MSVIPGSLYVFKPEFQVWMPAPHDVISEFAEAKKVYHKEFPPGSMMWKPIYRIYTSEKYNYYCGEDYKWYMSNIDDEISTLREIKEMEGSFDEEYREKLINSLISDSEK